MLDENRRATYNISSQPAARSESIFTTFEGEIKQLVAVCQKKLFSPLKYLVSVLTDFYFRESGWASCRLFLR